MLNPLPLPPRTEPPPKKNIKPNKHKNNTKLQQIKASFVCNNKQQYKKLTLYIIIQVHVDLDLFIFQFVNTLFFIHFSNRTFIYWSVVSTWMYMYIWIPYIKRLQYFKTVKGTYLFTACRIWSQFSTIHCLVYDSFTSKKHSNYFMFIWNTLLYRSCLPLCRHHCFEVCSVFIWTLPTHLFERSTLAPFVGTHHHAVHRIPWPHLLLLLCLPRRKRPGSQAERF